MKNVIILLLCLSLLLCSGCQAAANNTGTEPTAAPTVAPTVAPTQEPTQEPTAAPTQEPTSAPTEPPAVVEVVDAEVRYITYDMFYLYQIDERINPVSPLLHSVDEINAYILAEIERNSPGHPFVGFKWEEYDKAVEYNEAFFKENK